MYSKSLKLLRDPSKPCFLRWALYFMDDLTGPIPIDGNDHYPHGLRDGSHIPGVEGQRLPRWPVPGFNPQGEADWSYNPGNRHGRLNIDRGNFYRRSGLEMLRPHSRQPTRAVRRIIRVFFSIFTTDRPAEIRERRLPRSRDSPSDASSSGAGASSSSTGRSRSGVGFAGADTARPGRRPSRPSARI